MESFSRRIWLPNKNKQNTGYLCPVAEARAPLDRQMGVGLGVFCSRSLETKTNAPGIFWCELDVTGRPAKRPQAHACASASIIRLLN